MVILTELPFFWSASWVLCWRIMLTRLFPSSTNDHFQATVVGHDVGRQGGRTRGAPALDGFRARAAPDPRPDAEEQ